MSEKCRVAVLGLYRSGSSAAAGALYRLGVEMGAPYFKDCYEPIVLARNLRKWWGEPHLWEMLPREARVRALSEWIAGQEQKGKPWVGAKHPLLAARGEDLLEAWGPDVRFIWTHRPVEQSIESLLRLRWFTPPVSESLQRQLWEALNRFFSAQPHLRVEFADLVANPAREIDRMIEFLGIVPDTGQIEAAVKSVRYKGAAA